MPNRHKFKVAITQLTLDGKYIYGGCKEFGGEAVFTPTYNHCYFENITLRKSKGGSGGGNYIGVENGEIYRVMKVEKL